MAYITLQSNNEAEKTFLETMAEVEGMSLYESILQHYKDKYDSHEFDEAIAARGKYANDLTFSDVLTEARSKIKA
jgi:hypothetical protein